MDTSHEPRFVCKICGASDPKWLRHIDRSGADYAYRTMMGFPGLTSLPVRYCEKPECEFEVICRYGATGNDGAMQRLFGDLLASIEEHRP